VNRSREFLLAGAMTPAFALNGGAAEARFVEPVANGHVQNTRLGSERDKAALKQALLALSPAEKLRIASDRIRVAKKQTGTSNPPSGGQIGKKSAPVGGARPAGPKVPRPPKRNTGVSCNMNDCSGLLFAWA
jgi:hypothetical protein